MFSEFFKNIIKEQVIPVHKHDSKFLEVIESLYVSEQNSLRNIEIKLKEVENEVKRIESLNVQSQLVEFLDLIKYIFGDFPPSLLLSRVKHIFEREVAVSVSSTIRKIIVLIENSIMNITNENIKVSDDDLYQFYVWTIREAKSIIPLSVLLQKLINKDEINAKTLSLLKRKG